MSDGTLEKRLKHLEELVRDSAKAVEDLRRENAKLKADAARLVEANLRLDGEFRRFKSMSSKQEAVRERLEKAVKRLDKALELAGG
ncbi:MAG: hypothetical protein HYZ75_16860 [Elusimicrobia bacterium]|nr:hypothetical protein [Elusimicrobiota bacterium]